MAYNNLQRHYSVQVHSYIDGVPFRITDRFKPPPEVRLPVGFSLPSQTASLICTYDFHLEQQVIDWADALERAKVEQENSEQQQQCGELSRSNSSSSLEEDSPCRDITENAVGANAHVQQPLLNFGGDGILTPIKASNVAPNNTMASASANSTAFDYTQFENESDPFDSLELKSIDDLAELKDVLQSQTASNNSNNAALAGNANHSPQQETGSVSLQGNSARVSYSKNSSSPLGAEPLPGALSKPVPVARKSKLPPLPTNKSLTGNPSSSRPPRPPVPTRVAPPPPRPPAPLSKVPNKPKPVEQSPPRPPSYESLVNGTGLLSLETTRHTPASKTESNFYSRHSDEQISPRNGLTPINDPPPYSEEPVPKYGSSPNFLSCGGIPLPGLADISTRHPSSDQFDLEAWNRYTPLPPTPTMASPSRPGPYDNLTKRQQEYVDSMTGMGFPLDSAIRLVDKFGAEQKVLDVLCLINQVSELGYKKEDVETALLLLDCDESKTTHYLEALGQLRNMGFEDAKITEALVESDLDVDKALDHLTA